VGNAKLRSIRAEESISRSRTEPGSAILASIEKPDGPRAIGRTEIARAALGLLLLNPHRAADSQKLNSLARRLTCPSRLVPPFFVMLRGCVTEVLIGALLEHGRISASR
jgi:hypothetical protein